MAAVKLYGLKEFARFDPLTVVMSPADATVALLSGAGEINCSVALPPFMQFQLKDPKVHVVASSFELSGGPTTYTVAYTSAKFRDKNPKLYQAVYDALTEATDRVTNDIRTAARYWIEDSDSKLTVDFVAAAGSGKDVKWTTRSGSDVASGGVHGRCRHDQGEAEILEGLLLSGSIQSARELISREP